MPDQQAHTAIEAIEEVACTQECTGLMPAMPFDTAQVQALAGLMAIHCPNDTNDPSPAPSESPDADVHPSDAHSSRKNTPSFHPASEQHLFRPRSVPRP